MLNDSNRNNPLFKDIKEYNKYLLSLIGILTILLTGIISYNFSNNSYAKWSSNNESKNTLKLSIKVQNTDQSGANAPELTSNMIPVYYDETNDVWRKADMENKKENYKWYDYDNKMWANAVTVNKYNYNSNISSTNYSTSIKSEVSSYKESEGEYYTFSGSPYNNSCCVDSKPSIDANGYYELNATYGPILSGNQYCSEFFTTQATGGSCGNKVTTIYHVSKLKIGTKTYEAETRAISIMTIYTADKYKVSSSYSFDSTTGKYTLTNPKSVIYSSSYANYYMCSDKISTTCNTIYKIKEVNDNTNTITKVDIYKSEQNQNEINYKLGDEIPMDDINTMWVWIPRYTYTYLNTNTPQSINIKFESGTASSGTIKCTDAVTGTSTTSETCTDTTNNGLKAGTSTYTHPAFWWDKNDNNVRESGEELTGIWVGKFEVSNDTTCTATSNAAIGSGCNLQTIRPLIKPNVQAWRGAQVGTFFNGIQKMSASGNQYGFATTDETHMMKNMEWGAVTYLSHSKYGINKEVSMNSVNTSITGCGPQSNGSIDSGSVCNKYTTALGQSASTTGNVTGIYDMSGGSWEYLMSSMVYSNGQVMSGYRTTNNQNSAFTGILYDGGASFTGTYTFPSKRYYDKYSYGTSETQYIRGKLGDATKEMAPTGNKGNWYSNYSYFPYSSYPWIARGGDYTTSSNPGIFGFSLNSGSLNITTSTRAVISNLN